jgi:hypothetical protein
MMKSEPVSSFSRTVSWLLLLYVWCYNILCVCLSICAVVMAECCLISKTRHHGETRPCYCDSHNEEADTAVLSVEVLPDVFRSLITPRACRRFVSLNEILTCICLRRRLFRVTLEISRTVINLAYRAKSRVP